MTYSYEKVPQETSAKLDGFLSISKTGRIGLGSKFVADRGLTTDTKAQLYWDRNNKSLAIMFTVGANGEQSDTKYRRIHPTTEEYTIAFVNGDAGYIIAGGFFKALGLDPSAYSGRYPYTEMQASEVGITDARGPVFELQLEEAA